VTAFTMISLSPIYDQVYTIGDPISSITMSSGLINQQVPACGYTQTLSA